ncbi:MAG: AI-2E family transporter [Candidatus Pacebacteria bacterium]|nr:AI-2E family transporter [Candidatus Paceibacterota bacterium]
MKEQEVELKKLSLHISMGTLFKVFVFALAVYFAYQLRGLLLIILSSVVIASVIEPGTRWFVKRGFPRVLAAVSMYISIVAFVAGAFTFVIPPLYTETVSAINNLPKHIKTIDILSPIHAGTYNTVKTFFPDIPASVSVGDLASIFTGTVSDFSGGIFDTITSFFGGIISIVLVIVISFYLSVREDGVGEFLSIITPLRHERYVKGLWQRSQHKIGRWMQGQILLALSIGLVTYLSLLVVGIPHPLLLAFLAGVFELVPIIGLTLSVIPAFLLAMLDGGLGLGLIVVAVYVVIQQIESHLVYPLVVKKVIGVPPLLVIIALVAGAQLAGLVGALLAVPLSVALMEFIDDVERKKRFVTPEVEEEVKI